MHHLFVRYPTYNQRILCVFVSLLYLEWNDLETYKDEKYELSIFRKKRHDSIIGFILFGEQTLVEDVA